MVPMVVTTALIFICATRNPLMVPAIAATASAASMANTVGTPAPSVIAAVTLANVATAYWETSIPPSNMAMVAPAAMIEVIEELTRILVKFLSVKNT